MFRLSRASDLGGAFSTTAVGSVFTGVSAGRPTACMVGAMFASTMFLGGSAT